MNDLVLYTYFRSSASYRVRIALNYKGLPYESRFVHLVKNGGEQNSAEYLKLNPSGQVPYFKHGDNEFSQSLIILEYLDHTFKEKPVFPTNAMEKFKVMEFCEVINSGIQPLQNLRVLHYLKSDHGQDQEATKTWSAHWNRRGLDNMEKRLNNHGGSFCFGDTFTAADACFVPQVFSAARFGLALEDWPKVNAIYNNLMEQSYVDKAKPENQEDFA